MSISVPSKRNESIGGKEKLSKKDKETVGKEKTFNCQFYNKTLGGCGVKCPKNRNVCCYYCPLYERCMTVEDIAKEICVQVKEAK